MSATTSIEWTATVLPDGTVSKGASWTPLRVRRLDDGKVGVHCERVSPGCEHCYSERFNRRRLPNQGTGLPFRRQSRDLIEHFLDERILTQPLRWRRPRKVFVCSQTDLFGEWVTDEQIDRVFAVMTLAQQHTFQVLTKRPERMRSYLRQVEDEKDIQRWINAAVELGGSLCAAGHVEELDWPLRNVWLGTSCEDQQRADKRIPILLQAPAAVRFVSAEPLLGPVMLWRRQPNGARLNLGPVVNGRGLDWVVVGGESGPRARPCDIAWVRSIVEQCRAAEVACFTKQLGARPVFFPGDEVTGYEGISQSWSLIDSKGGDPEEWPEDLRVREFPRVEVPA